MMIPSTQKLNEWIPDDSLRVRSHFNCVKDESRGNLIRYGYAFSAIGYSMINLVGYATIIPTRIVTAIIYLNFQGLLDDCYFDARRTLNSFYFAVGMTAFIFATFFNPQLLSTVAS